MRILPLPHEIDINDPGFDFSTLRAHPHYAAAKSGDIRAAADIVSSISHKIKGDYSQGTLFLPVVSIQKPGDRHNTLPMALAGYLASRFDGQIATGIVQLNQASHTGADPMERMISRARFCGHIVFGARYTLVDDVATMGGTLADLSDFIQKGGGIITGIALLANNSRDGIVPCDKDKNIFRILEEREDGRFKQTIEQEFDVSVRALTRGESRYLVGFRNAAELRCRADAARSSGAGRVPQGHIPISETLIRPLERQCV